MRIFSQNLTNYDITLPTNSIFRINLAWINSLDELTSLLKKHKNSEIFMDLPIGRTKPPNNKYSFDDLVEAMVQNDLNEATKDSTLYKEGLIKPTWEHPI